MVRAKNLPRIRWGHNRLFMNGQPAFSRERFSESAPRSRASSSTQSSSTPSSRGRRQPIEDVRANAGILSHAMHRVQADGRGRAIDDAAWMPFDRRFRKVPRGGDSALSRERSNLHGKQKFGKTSTVDSINPIGISRRGSARANTHREHQNTPYDDDFHDARRIERARLERGVVYAP